MVLLDRASSSPASRNSSQSADQEHEASALVLDHDELEKAIESALSKAGCTLEQLRAEAGSGDFSSELNWRAWFCISGFIEDAI